MKHACLDDSAGSATTMSEPLRLAATLGVMSSPPNLDDPDTWCVLVDAVRPASILVAIEWRLGPDLRQRVSVEDVWQEVLLRAWESRASFSWQGHASFRSWLLTIADHCVEDQRRTHQAQCRDVSRTVTLNPPSASDGPCRPAFPEPWQSTTPSRIATEREHARAMQQALESLPDKLRDVVRLRLIEDQSSAAIAESMNLSESGVRHRLHKGAELFNQRVRALLGSSR